MNIIEKSESIRAGLRSRASPPPRADPSGTGRQLTSWSQTKSTRAGCCSRKQSVQAVLSSKTTASWPGISTQILMRPLFLMRYLGMPSRRNCNVQISQKENLPFNYSFDSTKLSSACCDGYDTGTFISAFKKHLFPTRIMFHSFYDIFLKMGMVIFICYAIIWVKHRIIHGYPFN